MKPAYPVLITLCLLAACSQPAAQPTAAAGPALAGAMQPISAAAAEPAAAQVVVNRTPLAPQVVAALTAQYRTGIQPGRYWYDRVSGLWGLEGGPYMGQLTPGLDLGGPLPADISGRGTGTFINGREIHVLEHQALQRAYGVVYPGRFWLMADGTFGQEGGPALGNLAASARSGATGGGSWSSYSPLAGSVGGDGSGCLYFNGAGDGSSWSNC